MTSDLLKTSLAAHRAGDLASAERGYRDILATRSDDAEALHLLAVIRMQQGRPAEALPLAEKSVTHDPTPAKPWNTLGGCLAALGRAPDAITAFRRAVANDADFAAARVNLANLLHDAGAEAEAETHLRLVLKANPDDAAAHNNLGSVLHAMGRGDEAETEFAHALRLAPTMPEARLNLGIRARETGDVELTRTMLAGIGRSGPRLLHDTALPAILANDADIDHWRKQYEQGLDALTERPASIVDPLAEIGQLPQFYLGYHGRDDRPLQEKLAAALSVACPSLRFQAEHCKPGQWQPGKRLRLGIVSRHLYNHTIGKLMQGLLAGLSQSGMDVFVFFLGQRNDEVSTRIAATSHSVRLPSRLDQARTTLAEARLDILLYPDIGMEPITYFLAHSRLAPLQMVTWGHPITSGLPSMDLFVSADSIEPVGAEVHYSEKLVRLPHPPLCYDRPPPVKPLDVVRLGLQTGGKLVVCPQTLFKFHPQFDALVAMVLRATPSARLILIEGRADWRRHLTARFATTLPDVADRIDFVPRLSQHDFIGLCAAADLMIDIPHWAGGNTTLEGLSTGTPIVTLPGPFMRGRFTAGLLGKAGLQTLIASDTADYVAKTAAILADPQPWRPLVRDRAASLYADPLAAPAFAALLREQMELARN